MVSNLPPLGLVLLRVNDPSNVSIIVNWTIFNFISTVSNGSMVINGSGTYVISNVKYYLVNVTLTSNCTIEASKLNYLEAGSVVSINATCDPMTPGIINKLNTAWRISGVVPLNWRHPMSEYTMLALLVLLVSIPIVAIVAEGKGN